jgi:3-oxoacyl-[acyl-carrier protein] reductase
MSLAERVAIVTGGGKGIGKHYCKGLAAEGAAVVVAEIDAAAAESTAAELRAAGHRAMEAPTDVSDEASVNAMVARTLDTFGRVDILVNNAAIFASVGFTHAPHDQISVEEWDRMFAVNVRGVWLCCKAVVPHMRRAGGGKIVNIASDTVLSGVPFFLHYVASKGAVIALTRALAREVGGDNICVNAVAPGFTLSEAGQAAGAEPAERSIAGRPLGRAEVPEDLVGTIVYLASPASDFVTGQLLAVNGGYVMH